MRRTALPILLFSLAVPLTLHAAPQLQPQGVVVTLSGEATKTVANDEALITFTVERRAATPEAVTEEVVTAGNKGLAALAATLALLAALLGPNVRRKRDEAFGE